MEQKEDKMEDENIKWGTLMDIEANKLRSRILLAAGWTFIVMGVLKMIFGG